MLVLVVDDSPLVRQHVKTLLPEFEVETAANGREGLKQFIARSPSLVILDIFMPEMDGFELLKAIRRLRPGVPAIAMSTSGTAGLGRRQVDYLSMLHSLGASAMLRKPFTRDELLEAIEGAVAGGQKPEIARRDELAPAP